jgi:hypothetical protein
MRLRLRFEGEQIEPSERAYKLLAHEIPTLKCKLQAEKAVAHSELTQRAGQLRYLQNLTKTVTVAPSATAGADKTHAPTNGLDAEQSASTNTLLAAAAATTTTTTTTMTTTTATAGATATANDSDCAICYTILGEKVVMLVCGHRFCWYVCVVLLAAV